MVRELIHLSNTLILTHKILSDLSQMEEYTQARCRAAQNAILLASLDELPIPPCETELVANSECCALTLRRETQLADDFAFISSMKHDPNRVTAICLEANQNGDGIVFRIASNSGSLERVVKELQAIADIMMQTSRHSASTRSEPMCIADVHGRYLSRRSKPATI